MYRVRLRDRVHEGEYECIFIQRVQVQNTAEKSAACKLEGVDCVGIASRGGIR